MKKFFTLLTLFFTFAVITNAQETPFFEQTFETDLGDMATYSVVGDQVWEWGNYGEPEGCATMTGHVHPDDFANEDWLITPALDFTGKTNVAFSFMEAINYESSIEDNEKVYISTDYDGTGNPNNFTWEQLTVTNRASGEDWSFVTVDDIDLSAYDEESTVYIAFKFTCTDAGSGTWEIDNIAVFEDLNLPELVVTEPNGYEVFQQGEDMEITWTSENFTDNVKLELTGTNATVIAASVENTGTYIWTIPADQPVAADYKVKVSDAADGDPMDESDDVFEIIEPINALYIETFDTDLGTWTAYSVTGDDQVWSWADYGDPEPGCAKMSGYASGTYFDNEDWLISPAMNLDNSTQEILTFSSAFKYDGPAMQLMLSTDYDGSGNPSENGTWSDITDEAAWSDGEFNWVESGEIDLSTIEGSAVYLAFVYQSSASLGAATWEIDNIIVQGEGSGLAAPSLDFNNTINVYPNPSDGRFTLTADKEVSATITIYALTGEKVYQTQLNSKETVVDLGNIPAGIYTLQMINENNQVAAKRLLIK